MEGIIGGEMDGTGSADRVDGAIPIDQHCDGSADGATDDILGDWLGSRTSALGSPDAVGLALWEQQTGQTLALIVALYYLYWSTQRDNQVPWF